MNHPVQDCSRDVLLSLPLCPWNGTNRGKSAYMYQLRLFERWRFNLRPRATSSLVRRASGILSSKPQRRKPSLLRPKTVPSVKEMSSSERLWSNCSSHPLRGKIFWRQSTIPKFICYEHMWRASKAHYWCELQLKIDKSKTIYAKYTYTVGRAVTVPLRRKKYFGSNLTVAFMHNRK